MKSVSLIMFLMAAFMFSCEKGGLPEPIIVVDDEVKIDTLANSDDSIAFDTMASLKELYTDDFLIGVSLNTNQTQNGLDNISNQLVTKHFNSIVAGNAMKSRYIQPSEGYFYFDEANNFVSYGETNNMAIIGHTLVWHSQVPDWIFTDNSGIDVSREVLLSRMKSHINTLAGKYKGQIRGWDVVNEAVDNNQLRNSKWHEIIGPDYLDSAFYYASQADPNAELYYNDYGLYKEAKRNRTIQLIQDLQAANIKIDAVGMQAHYKLDTPIDEVEKSIVAFANLGIKVMITELDISVLPLPPWSEIGDAEIGVDEEYDALYDPYVDGLPEEIEIQLANKYRDLFELFLKHSDKILRVTFWGLNDGESWKNNHPIKGRTDYPLLFDRENKPKKAFYELLKLKQ